MIQPSCFGLANGSVWPTGAQLLQLYSGPTLLGDLPVSNLAAGTYTVRKTVSGCSANLNVTLVAPAQLTVNAVVTSEADCCGDNGAANASATGGTVPYSYNWGNGITGGSPTGLNSGVYTVTVNDNNACSATATITIIADCSTCTDIVAIDSVAGTEDDSIQVCVPLTQSALAYYELLVDGQLYQGSTYGCDFDSIVAYSYAAVIASGPAPYRLLSWACNGMTITNKDFQNFSQLADSIR